MKQNPLPIPVKAFNSKGLSNNYASKPQVNSAAENKWKFKPKHILPNKASPLHQVCVSISLFLLSTEELIQFLIATRTVTTQLAEVGCLSFQELTEGVITSGTGQAESDFTF